MEHRTKDEWTALVAEYRNSGKTMKSFCEEHGVNYKTFGNYAHRRSLKERTTSGTQSRSPEEWLTLIAEQKASGKSRAAWCRERDIRSDAMTKAEKRLMANSMEPAPALEWLELNSQTNTDASPAGNEDASYAVKIRTADLEIEAPANYPVEKLAILIRGLVK